MPFNPHLAPAAIQEMLKERGHEIEFADLNIGFYNSVMNPNFIKQSIDATFQSYNTNIAKVNEIRAQNPELRAFPKEFQRVFLRFKELEKVNASKKFVNSVLKNLPAAASIVRDKELFYNPEALENAFAILGGAAELLSSLYYPSTVNFLKVSAQSSYDLEELKLTCSDKAGNIFYNYYEAVLQQLLKSEPEFIGLSLGDYTQLIPTLTLAMMLKKVTKAHISIGGNLFGRYTDVLINNPEFFNLFADSIIYNEGERPLIELMEHLEGKRKIEDVANLIYLKDGKVQSNKEKEPIKIEVLATPDFSGFPLQYYYTPELIYNMQTSRNCYWKKCTFCTHHHGSKYGIKSVNKVVKDIKILQEKYGAKYFHFVDEAMSPAYLKKLSQKILDEGIDMRFYIYGRLEKEFTKDIFELGYKAGLRLVMWGFESANERIYTLMNKGELTSSESRRQILKDAYDSGVWNHLFIMFDFPSETLDEAKETVDFLRDNRNILSHSTGGKFVLLENAPILKDLKKYSISKVEKFRSGFSFAHKFETTQGMSQEQYQELEVYKREQWRINELKYQSSWYREKLFLYVCKYGTEQISQMKEQIWL
jgi:radical SAM superfamily enzyme YgiQ (UPF0313 family)